MGIPEIYMTSKIFARGACLFDLGNLCVFIIIKLFVTVVGFILSLL